jgi:hypothetical protein
MSLARLVAAIILFLTASAALAHHIWIVPDGDGGSARAVFGDTLDPGSPRLLDHIAQTRLWFRDGNDQESRAPWKRGENSFVIPYPQPRPRAIGGECIYGVEIHDHRLRSDVPPYLLVYYPKSLLGPRPSEKPWPKLMLEIVPVVTPKSVRLQVLFKGRPAAKAEMIVFAPDGDNASLISDKEGRTELPLRSAGIYGFRTRVLQDAEGTHEGKQYGQIRHYASLVVQLSPSLESD